MASFTDQTPQFNPYIQQQPVEAMMKVGMEKQRRYDEGVQKIQTSIDNVAGLDIINPTQQQYLQSKLNDLGSKLKTVAAGDFSNYQLVNSVGGMATQIGNDKVVQNAVGSTARIRKGQQEQETARKEGKSHVNNDNFWANRVNEFVSSTDVNQSFGGNYIQYTDVTKKLNEVASKMVELDSTIEIPYQRDSAGNILKGENGKPLVDDAILKITTKGKPAEKLLAAFYDNLDDNDKQQLGIDAWANYRGSTKETFIKDIQSNYDTTKKLLTDNAVDLAVKLKGANLSTGLRARYEAELKDTNTVLNDGSLEKSLNSKISELDKINDGNIDAFKTQLYTQKRLGKLAQDTSYQNVAQEYKTNPYAQMAMERKKLEFAVNRARMEDQHWAADYSLKIKEFEYKKYTDQKAKEGDDLIVTPGGLRTDVPIPTINDVDKRLDDSKVALKQLENSYLPLVFKGTNLTPAQKAESMNKIYEQYLINPKSVDLTDNNMRKYFNQRRGLEIEQAQVGQLRLGAANAGKVYDDQITARLKSARGLTLNGVHYNGKDLYDIASTANNFVKEGASHEVNGTQVGGRFFDKDKFLKQYAGTPKQRVAEIIAKSMSGGTLTTAERTLNTHVRGLQVDNARFVHSIYKQKFDAQSQFLAAHMPEMQTQNATLSRDSKVDMDHTERLISKAIDDYNERGALDVERKEDFNPETINEWRSNSKSQLDYIIKKNYDGSASFVIQNGTKKQIIPIPAGQLGQYFPNAGRRNSFDGIQSAIMASPNHTTNLTGGRDAVNAYMTGEDLPLLKGTALSHRVRVDIEGSGMDTPGQANNDFQVVVYVQKGDGTWKPRVLNNKGFTSQDGVSAVLSQIGTQTIAEILK